MKEVIRKKLKACVQLVMIAAINQYCINSCKLRIAFRYFEIALSRKMQKLFMRLLVLAILNVIVFTACNQNSKNANYKTTSDIPQHMCHVNYDTALIGFAQKFQATNIDLDRSISTNLNNFLLSVDTICLRKQKQYKFFIAAILAKLFYYHLIRAHQGFDLQSMERGGAKVIIEEFKKMTGYQNKQLEMLNSAVVVDFIQNNPELKDNSTLKKMVNDINEEADKIDKMHHVKKSGVR